MPAINPNQWVDITATCKFHKKPRTDTVRVKRADLNRWMAGELVQKVWPDYPEQMRYLITTMRTGDGTYVCPSCWEELDE